MLLTPIKALLTYSNLDQNKTKSMSDVPPPPVTPERPAPGHELAAAPPGRTEVSADVVAAIVAALAARPQQDALAGFFARQEERTLEPWRARLATVSREADGLRAADDATTQALALDLARAQLLGAGDVLLLSALVWADDSDRAFYRSLLLRRLEWPERVRAHNWWVARKCGETFLAAYAARLDSFPWPLFPAAAQFSGLNTKLLAESSDAPAGGGRGKPSLPRVYREDPRNAILGGADYFVPCVRVRREK